MSLHRYQHLLYLAGTIFLIFAIGHYLYTHKPEVQAPEIYLGGELPKTNAEPGGSKTNLDTGELLPASAFEGSQGGDAENGRVIFDPTELPGYDLVEDPEFNPTEGIPMIPADIEDQLHAYDPGEDMTFGSVEEVVEEPTEEAPVSDIADETPPDEPVPDPEDFGPAKTHNVLYSRSTSNKKYFKINSRDHSIYNANIIPHPQHNISWIVIGQRNAANPSYHFSELYCEAIFLKNELFCIKNPLTLTIGSAPSFNCNGSMAMMGFSMGPHDARAFYSPDFPILTYGAKSHYTCLGQFAADIRTLMDWEAEPFESEQFRAQTEINRPPPYSSLEKNWFLWWDTKGHMYAHYDLEPRSFAKIEWDGSASPNLATNVPAVAAKDQMCIERFVPRTSMDENEAVHQSTNSLAVTLCNRSDPTCVPKPTNTYVMAIFQHKICPGIHSTYEPYVMLLQQDAPFSLIGISKKPLWIYGRLLPGEHDGTYPEQFRPDDESEMIYVTSMSWKTHGQKFHGYMDDELFLSFGLEDTHAGGIDVLASDILQDIGLCADTKEFDA